MSWRRGWTGLDETRARVTGRLTIHPDLSGCVTFPVVARQESNAALSVAMILYLLFRRSVAETPAALMP